MSAGFDKCRTRCEGVLTTEDTETRRKKQTHLSRVRAAFPSRLLTIRGLCYGCPRISGNPFLLFPITTTLEFALLARVSVASMPFHSSSDGVMPWATICWKSRTPCADVVAEH